MSREVKVSKDYFLVSKTDTNGVITYCNEEFMRIAGYKEKELLGKPHNIVRHPDMPKAVFKLLWEKIKSKEEVFAYVKNKTSDDGFYWVYANVTASLDENGNIIGYHSVRRMPNPKALQTIKELYKKMLELESSQGMEASYRYLLNLLIQKELGYNQFIVNLQHNRS